MKSVNDAPYRAEQSDERRDRAGGRQPCEATLQARQLFGSGDLGGALHGGNVARPLALEFVVAVLKHGHQRAGIELLRNRGYVLQALRFAEGTQEASALHPRPAQR